jgi:hypothetical protein
VVKNRRINESTVSRGFARARHSAHVGFLAVSGLGAEVLAGASGGADETVMLDRLAGIPQPNQLGVWSQAVCRNSCSSTRAAPHMAIVARPPTRGEDQATAKLSHYTGAFTGVSSRRQHTLQQRIAC